MTKMTLTQAVEIARKAHAGQVDKAGKEYFEHPWAVMAAVSGESEQMAAILHDVLEDTKVTIAELRAQGCPEEVLRILDAVTRRSSETYFDFVRRAGSYPPARRVKRADLMHNSDITRIAAPTERDRERVKRYEKALKILDEIEAQEQA